MFHRSDRTSLSYFSTEIAVSTLIFKRRSQFPLSFLKAIALFYLILKRRSRFSISFSIGDRSSQLCVKKDDRSSPPHFKEAIAVVNPIFKRAIAVLHLIFKRRSQFSILFWEGDRSSQIFLQRRS
jgi:hypothetical protein